MKGIAFVCHRLRVGGVGLLLVATLAPLLALDAAAEPNSALTRAGRGPTSPGAVRWVPDLSGATALGAPAIGADGTCYLATTSVASTSPFGGAGGIPGRVMAFDGRTGARKWQYEAFSFTVAPTLGANGLLYIAGDDSVLYALDTTTGTNLWTAQLLGSPTGSSDKSAVALGPDGTVFLCAGYPTQMVYAVDGTTGALKWQHAASGKSFDPEPGTSFSIGPVSSPAVGTNGTLYLGGSDGTVSALDGATGTLIWEYSTGKRVRSSPAIGPDGAIYVGSDNGKVYALDGATGQPRWTVTIGGFVTASPILGGNGTLYIGGPDRRLYALDSATGLRQWAYACGGAIPAAAALANDGTVYFSAQDGYLYALDAAGNKKWEAILTLAVGACPSIGDEGTVFAGGYAWVGTAALADAPWPKFHQGRANRGLAPRQGVPPTIVRPPAGGLFAAGASVALTVEADGTPPLSYRWFHDNQALPDANGTVYLLPSFRAADAGLYAVLVLGPAGVARSAPAELRVGYRLTCATNGPGRVLREPALDVYEAGATVTLTALPEGSRRFLGWSGAASGTNSQTTVTLDRDLSVQARFEFQPGDERWRWATGLPMTQGAPGLGTNGSIYLAGRDSGASYLYALDTRDGQVRWRFRCSQTLAGPPVLGSDGTVHIVVDQTLYALDGNVGTQRWATAIGQGTGVSTLAVAADGTVYACGNALYALDPETGTPRWQVPALEAATSTSPAVGPDGVVYVSLASGGLCAVNPQGAQQWTRTYPFAASQQSSPVVDDVGRVYVGTPQSGLFGLSTADGTVLWNSAVPTRVGGASVVLGWNHTAYVTSAGGDLVALNTADTSRKWTVHRSSETLTAPALAADGTLYVGGAALYALDAIDGSSRWTCNTGAAIMGALAVGPDGSVYAFDNSGTLHAVTGTAPLAATAWPKDRGDVANRSRTAASAGRPPTLARQLVGGLFKVGQDVPLTLLAQGAEPLSFQWYYEGRRLTNRASATLLLSGFGSAQAGEYYAVVLNAFGSTTSAPVRLEAGFELNIVTNGPGWVGRTPDAPLYRAGDAVALQAFPLAGHRFLRWSGDVTGAGDAVQVLMDRHQQVVAYFDMSPGQSRWSFATDGAIVACPTLGADGGVYVGSADGRLYALDANSGLRRWSFATGAEIVGSAALGRNGLVYVGSKDKRLYALDAATGERRWGATFEAAIGSSPAVGTDGHVYVTAESGVVRAFDGTNGNALWSAVVDTGANSPTLGEDGTVYVVSLSAQTVSALDGATGKPRWTSSPARRVNTAPILGANGTVYVGLAPIPARWTGAPNWGGVTALDLATGDVQGDFVLRAATAIGAPALGLDGGLYLGLANQLYALDPALRAPRWSYAAGAEIQGAPALARDGTVYVGSLDGRLHALDGGQGKPLWTFQAGGPLRGSPTVGMDGTVYVGSDDGRLYAVAGSSPLADSPWPNFRGGRENPGARQFWGPPLIVTQPVDRGAVEGQPTTLSVGARGAWPLRYQWFFEGQPLPGATGTVFAIARFGPANAGRYSVEVTNATGRVQSAPFSLSPGFALQVTVAGPGTVTREPDLEAYPSGATVVLTAHPASGTAERPFLGWGGDAGGTETRLTLAADRNRAVTARFVYLPGEPKWAVDFAGPLNPLPAIGSDGTVYVESNADRDWSYGDPTSRLVGALDPATGGVRWMESDRTAHTVCPAPWDPVVGADDTVYVTTRDPANWGAFLLKAMDGATGTIRWQTSLADLPGWAAIGANGDIYTASTNNALEAFSPAAGQPVWSRLQRSSAFSGLALDGAGGVYTGSKAGTASGWDEATGDLFWQTDLGGPVGSHPAMGLGGTIYFTAGGTNLLALNTATGQPRWSLAGAWGEDCAPIADSEGRVFVAETGPLRAIDGATGVRQWSFQPGTSRVYTPTLGGDGVLYALASDGKLYALDSRDGKARWSHPLSSGPSSKLVSALDILTTRASGVGSLVALSPEGTLYVPVRMQGEEEDHSLHQSWSWGYGRLQAIQASAGLAVAPWPAPHGDARNSGRSPSPSVPIRVVEQPRGETLMAGQSATLSVRAVGTPPLAYQWYDGAAGDTRHPVADATAASWTTPPLNATATYWARVSNAADHADSQAATLFALPASPEPALQVTRARAGLLQLRILGLPGSRWRIEYSDDLRAWTPYDSVLTIDSAPAPFPIPIPAKGQRYFRATGVL